MANAYLFRVAPNEVDKIVDALRRNRIYLGWRTPGLLSPNLTKRDFKQAIRKSHPGRTGHYYGNAVAHVWRFINTMEVGDLVIVPPQDRWPFYLARITGPPREYRGTDPDIAFERAVQWFNGKQPFMRSDVSASLDKFLTYRRTSRLLQGEALLREVESLAGGEWLYPDELDESETYWEGTQKQVTVNAYERDPKARAACIKHYGPVCVVCDFDFEAQYGDFGAGLIHVHHLRALSKIRKGYRVKPKRDLRPVCPNCHAIIHWKRKMLTIAEAKRMVLHPFAW